MNECAFGVFITFRSGQSWGSVSWSREAAGRLIEGSLIGKW